MSLNFAQPSPTPSPEKYGPTITIEFIVYLELLYTKTVDKVKGSLSLPSQTLNVLCYLPPSNSGKNGVPVCIRDK